MLFRVVLIYFTVISCTTGRMVETQLYFGQSKPDGSMVSEKEWSQFEEEYIMKIFTQGFSVNKIEGRWQDTVTNQLITEPAYQVTCFHKQDRSLSNKIDNLRSSYQKLFQQQSVLRIDKKVKGSF